MKIYLDNAATTPLLPEVADTMCDVLKNHFGNPSSIHSYGRQSKALVEEARKTIARYLGASIGEVVFTSCGSESNNTALKCAIRDLEVKRIISSRLEHHNVLHSLYRLEKEGIQIEWVGNDSKGIVDLDDLKNKLDSTDQKTMVSLMHANNEIGTCQDIIAIDQLCHEAGVLFHSDTVQSIAQFPFDLSEMNMAFIAASAHKFHGPKGVGFLYVNSNNIIEPFIDGGAQERKLRAGTENVAGIVGMAKAFDIAIKNQPERRKHLFELKDYLAAQLFNLFPKIKFNGDIGEDSLPTVLSVTFPPHPKDEMLLMYLDIEGIAASGGSACTSGANQLSHVIQQIDPDELGTTIRFSFSQLTTIKEIKYLLEKLSQILE